ncbi:MAG: aminopeptidase P family protein [Candidatus Marinimicrobia bacterium]|nr:aminopeptidase P family protein [Candidatus Neomarinimicrobiota bacterium]
MVPPLRREFIKSSGLALAAASMGVMRKPAVTFSAPIKSFNLSDAPAPVSRREYKTRQEKAKTLMHENGISAILLTGGTSLKYFTGVSWNRSERTFAWVLPADGRAMWVCPAFESDRAEERIGSGADIRRWEEDESPYGLIAEFLKERKIGSGKIGFESTVRYFVFEGIKAKAPNTDIVSADPIINGCRGIKTAHEIELLRYINKVTLEVIKSAFKRTKSGMTEGELSGIISAEYAELGLRGWALVLFGPNAAYPHGTKNQETLTPGQLVLIDTGTSIHGYQSDITRTLAFGDPGKRQIEAFETVREAQSKALQTAKPGVTAGDVDSAARRVIEKAGYGKGYTVFTHRLGHGIGMSGHEYPYLVKGNNLKLAPGMTFSNEPGIYIRGELGVRLEDIMLITENGSELFTKQAASLKAG